MSLFTYTPQNDGTVADVADINAPFQQVATILNGNIDASNIAAGSISTDRLTSSANPETRQKRNLANYVVSGMTLGTSGTLSSTIAAGVAYINGKEVTPSAFPKTFTASKDTYVDLKDDGTYAFVEVANNATSGMTLTTNTDGSNALRIAKVVTSATAVVQVLQSAFNTAPVAPNTLNWFGFDALGNAVYNCDPAPKLIGYAHITSDFSSAASGADIPGLQITVIVPAGRIAKISGFIGGGSASAANNAVVMNITNVGSGTAVSIASGSTNASSDVAQVTPYCIISTPGTYTFKGVLGHGVNGATAHTNSTPNNPSYIMAELVR